jgi:hypothetical protein
LITPHLILPLPLTINELRMKVQPTSRLSDQRSHTGVLSGLEQVLQTQIASLTFSVFAAFVADVLTAAGYREVRPAPRHLYFKGRNQGGGYDLTALLPGSAADADEGSTAVGSRRVVVQVKQYPCHQAVPQSYVDQLRGVCLREGAPAGLLVTTGRFAPPARENAEASQRSAVVPIHLLDGETLLSLALQHRIGVRPTAGETLILDTTYFERLAQRASARQGRSRLTLRKMTRPVAGAVPSPVSDTAAGQLGERRAPVVHAASKEPSIARPERQTPQMHIITRVTVLIGRGSGLPTPPDEHGQRTGGTAW